MKQAVLLLAHGAPERVEDVPEYLRNVLGGRPVGDEIVAEVQERYAAIGGASPLTARTREQATALQAELSMPVYVGMRNWTPFISETLERMKADGINRIIALCLAPQYSKMSVGFYFRRVQEARQALGLEADIIWTKSFHDHPLVIEAFREKLALLEPAEMTLFTAHSLPEKILENRDPYDSETKATASLVAQKAALPEWEFAYQSQGMSGGQWLGPTVESRLVEYAGNGIQNVNLAPIGFVSDHVEVLYDIDIAFRDYAAERGIRLRRTESLNDSPTFIRALAEVVRSKMEAN